MCETINVERADTTFVSDATKKTPLYFEPTLRVSLALTMPITPDSRLLLLC